MFDIRTSADFYRKCLDDYESLLAKARVNLDCACHSFSLRKCGKVTQRSQVCAIGMSHILARRRIS